MGLEQRVLGAVILRDRLRNGEKWAMAGRAGHLFNRSHG